jgi:hypothetical protein
MTNDEPLPGEKRLVREVTEGIGIQENLVLKELSEKDPVLKDLLERDKHLKERIKDRGAKINEAFQVLEERIKKTLRET